jgi:hypothetical protein
VARETLIALPEVYTAGSIGLSGLQAARWNVLNPPLPAPIVGPTCSVTLSFRDGSGNVIKTESVTLKAGESRSLTMRSTDIPSTGNPTGLYALAVVPITAPNDEPAGRTCTLFTTLEVVDPATGATQAVTRGELVKPRGLIPLSNRTTGGR